MDNVKGGSYMAKYTFISSNIKSSTKFKLPWVHRIKNVVRYNEANNTDANELICCLSPNLHASLRNGKMYFAARREIAKSSVAGLHPSMQHNANQGKQLYCGQVEAAGRIRTLSSGPHDSALPPLLPWSLTHS